MRWIIFNIFIWVLAVAASLFGQTRLETLFGENLLTLSFFLLYLPYPVWYARSALAARKYGHQTTMTKACLILSSFFILLCLLMIALLISGIALHATGLKSDIPIVDFNTAFLIIGFLIFVNLVSVILATASLRATESAFLGDKTVINPILCFFAFFYLPIGMFFLKSRIEALRPDTTFD